jgi:hypothetical protein
MVDKMDAPTKQRLDELMPWYVSGRIDGQDRAWVERVISEHPTAHAELNWHRVVQEAVREDVESLPAGAGLQRLLARVRAEEAAKPSWLARLREGWAKLASGPAFAFAAVLVVVQAGVIGVLLSQEAGQTEFAQTRSLAPEHAAPEPVLQVTFKPDVTERDMRLLLARIGGRFIDGPGQLGDYIVLVPVRQIELARQQLEESRLVEQVTVLDQPPARD